MKTEKNSNIKIQWLYNLVRKSRTPWRDSDFLRICWYLDEDNKAGVYEYRDIQGHTNGFSITSLLSQKMPKGFDQKYFTYQDRAVIFNCFFDQIKQFIIENVEDLEFFNFTGVTKEIFFSHDSQQALKKLVN